MDYLDEIVKKKKKNERVFVIDRRERKRKRETRDDGFESKCSFDTNVNEKKNCFYFLLLFYLFTFFFPLSHESVSLSSLENPKWLMVGETRMYRQSGEGVSFPGGAWCGGVSQLNGHR